MLLHGIIPSEKDDLKETKRHESCKERESLDHHAVTKWVVQWDLATSLKFSFSLVAQIADVVELNGMRN